MPKHTKIIAGVEAGKTLVALLVIAVLMYAYLSFDFYLVALKAAMLYNALTQLGIQPIDAFIFSIQHAYGGILGDVGALLHGYPTSRDFTAPYWITKFMSVFEAVTGGG